MEETQKPSTQDKFTKSGVVAFVFIFILDNSWVQHILGKYIDIYQNIDYFTCMACFIAGGSSTSKIFKRLLKAVENEKENGI